jgi:peroxiredoxin Q/BCP
MTKNLLGALVALAAAGTVSTALANPKVGEAAPEFRLQDQNYEWHALDDYAGKWTVLYFYPKADTPGCTVEACEFRDNIFAFDEAGVAIVGVSLDDVTSQKEFAEKYHLPFPLLSDAKQEVATRYGVLTKFGDVPIASRQTFVIDPAGRIAKHYSQVNPDTHTAQVLEDLKALM